MINATELRIWNLVYFKGVLNKIVAVWISKSNPSKSYFHCEPIDDKVCDNPKIGFHGITLTEEWLLRFGFKKKENGYYINIFGGSLRFNNNKIALFIGSDYSLNIAMDYDYIELPREIKYVHQLQNLYFALTGEELQLHTWLIDGERKRLFVGDDEVFPDSI